MAWKVLCVVEIGDNKDKGSDYHVEEEYCGVKVLVTMMVQIDGCCKFGIIFD